MTELRSIYTNIYTKLRKGWRVRRKGAKDMAQELRMFAL